MEYMGKAAFSNCERLSEVILGNGVKVIEDEAFEECLHLTSIVIPSNVKKLSNGLFNGCSMLKEVTINDGATHIGHQVFLGCKSLAHINIRSSMEVIENNAFSTMDDKILQNINIHLETKSTINFVNATNCSIEQLKTRFKYLPLHHICFNHSKYTLDEFADELSRCNIAHSKKVDCQGMTILHILLLSDIQDLGKCRLVYELYPDAIITRDNHGETPLEYLIEVSGAEPILSFFLEMRGSRFGIQYPLDIDQLFKLDRHSLFFGVISTKIIRKLIIAQRQYNPHSPFLWDEMPHRIYRVLVEMSYSRREHCMSVEDSDSINKTIREMGPCDFEISMGGRRLYHLEPEEERIYRHELLQDIHNNIVMHTTYLHEVSSLLELSLWKNMLNGELKPDVVAGTVGRM